MGKRLIQQRRGRGTPRYRSPSHNFIGRVLHRPYDEFEKKGIIKGKVVDLIKCIGHSGPLAIVEYENGEVITMFASEGIHTGKEITSGHLAPPETGNIIPLKK